MTKKCPHCDKTIPADASFCPFCSRKLHAERKFSTRPLTRADRRWLIGAAALPAVVAAVFFLLAQHAGLLGAAVSAAPSAVSTASAAPPSSAAVASVIISVAAPVSETAASAAAPVSTVAVPSEPSVSETPSKTESEPPSSTEPASAISETASESVSTDTVYAPASDFVYSAVEGGVVIAAYVGSGGDVTVPPTLGGYPVVGVGERAFALENVPVQSLTFSEGLTYIEYAAFYLSTVTELHFPASLVTLAEQTVMSTQQLRKITVAEGNPAFCAVNGVLFSADMTVLWRYPCAAEGTYYVVPATVTTIYTDAFSFCANLRTVVLNDGLTELGFSCFVKCSSLSSLLLPDSLRVIRECAFQNCTLLTDVVIPEGVVTLERMAFNVSGIKFLTLPASLTYIGDHLFGIDTPYPIPKIYVTAGSYAQSWCEENGYGYVIRP